MDSLKRELVMLKMEKDKVMEMGLLEKIQL